MVSAGSLGHSVDLASRLALDVQGVGDLKAQAHTNAPDALKTVARQFEAVFMNMLMKSMRDATPQDGLFDSEQTKTFTAMLDQQFAQTMANRGLGLADMMVRQLSGGLTGAPTGNEPAEIDPAGNEPAGSATDTGVTDAVTGVTAPGVAAMAKTAAPALAVAASARNVAGIPAVSTMGGEPSLAERIVARVAASRPAQARSGENAAGVNTVSANSSAVNTAAVNAYSAAFGIDSRAASARVASVWPAPSGDAPGHVAAFVDKLLSHAQVAAQASGIPAHYMLGQAALETGWGRSELRGADGSNSHNLFGIKAGAGWRGATVDVTTTEYTGGVAQKQVERFRAYGSYAESFADYARLLKQNTRYQAAVNAPDAAGFAQGLQRGGYATDPAYAAKLERTIALAARAG